MVKGFIITKLPDANLQKFHDEVFSAFIMSYHKDDTLYTKVDAEFEDNYFEGFDDCIVKAHGNPFVRYVLYVKTVNENEFHSMLKEQRDSFYEAAQRERLSGKKSEYNQLQTKYTDEKRTSANSFLRICNDAVLRVRSFFSGR